MKKKEEAGTETTWLAWAGWRMRIPALWRPLEIDGASGRGKLMVGDAQRALMQIKWWRPGRSRFKAEAWLARRARAETMTTLPGGPKPEGFESTAWMKQVDTAGHVRFIWYGVAPEGGLVLEATLNGALPNRTMDRLRSRVLPSLRVSRWDEPVAWAMFDVCFEAPPGFDIGRRRIQLGDIALELLGGRDGRLVLRQVYPAALALERRDMRKWIRDSPIKEYRGFRGQGEPEEWTAPIASGEAKGLRWRGSKQLNFPLGWCSRRRSERAVLHDARLDRLLMVECDLRKADTGPVVRNAMTGMNGLSE